MRTVVVFSGGLDSTTLLYHVRALGHETKALTVDYGQRHAREIDAARSICAGLDIEHQVIDLSGLVACFGSNAITQHEGELPGGAYEESSMQMTTVPNRNMILLSIAVSWAISLEFDSVAYGAHSGEYTPYPDCRLSFASAMNCAAQLCDWNAIEILSPFVKWSKADIVRRGQELGVPFELTWSCYAGGGSHCGNCATCLDRKQAFALNSTDDPAFRMNDEL